MARSRNFDEREEIRQGLRVRAEEDVLQADVPFEREFEVAQSPLRAGLVPFPVAGPRHTLDFREGFAEALLVVGAHDGHHYKDARRVVLSGLVYVAVEFPLLRRHEGRGVVRFRSIIRHWRDMNSGTTEAPTRGPRACRSSGWRQSGHPRPRWISVLSYAPNRGWRIP